MITHPLTFARIVLRPRQKRILALCRVGRQTVNRPEAQLKRAHTQRQNALAQHAWKPSGPANMGD